MIAYQDIRHVHLELTTLCNAACPLCPRSFHGYPHNGGYPELYMTLDQAKKIFARDFIQQLTQIQINGNFGDIVMNPDGADIVEYFREQNQTLKIIISTNGGARNREFWQRLARAGSRIKFCLDGLEDTHHLYRQNTSWKTVIGNARTFINTGGKAVWKMIRFKHNEHQIEQCRELSRDLGFKKFELVDDGRDTGPVFDKNGNLTHILGNYTGETDFKKFFFMNQKGPMPKPKKQVTCKAVTRRSIYIAANGDVTPCCWTGFFPKTFRGSFHDRVNPALAALMKKNNSLEHPLQECIEWFVEIQSKWSLPTYEQGRLLVCDIYCGNGF